MIIIDILLWLLKWLGILLLVLLGLLLFLVLVVLLAPVRYKGRFRKTEEPDDTLFAEGRITWLNPILRICVRYEGKKLIYRARLFGFCIVNSEKPKKEKKKKKKEKSAPEHTMEESVPVQEENPELPEESDDGKDVQVTEETPAGEDTPATEESSEAAEESNEEDASDESEEKGSFFTKIKGFFGKIKAFFVKLKNFLQF